MLDLVVVMVIFFRCFLFVVLVVMVIHKCVRVMVVVIGVFSLDFDKFSHP